MTRRRSGPDGPATSSPEELVEQHHGLAARLARRYSFGSAVDEDLHQVAQLGLLLASRRFDPDLGSFVRFATVTIVGELKKHLRSHGWGVRVPRSLQEDSITVAAARDRLTAQLRRAPSVAEVADHTGFELERVVEATRAREARFTTSSEATGLDVATWSSTADAAILAHAISALSETDRRLIELRFDEGLSQEEIGQLIGVTQPHASRRIKAALTALQALLEDRG